VEFRIGERDGQTGLYQVIWPDGSLTLNGMKIFNSEHRVGDVVQATRRSDGMMILDGPKGGRSVSVAELTGGRGRAGYLNGQVFNDEVNEEASIELVPLINDPIDFGIARALRIRRSNSSGRLIVQLALIYDENFFNNVRFGPNQFITVVEGYYLLEQGKSSVDIEIFVTDTPFGYFAIDENIVNVGIVPVAANLLRTYDITDNASFSPELTPRGKYRIRGGSCSLLVQGQLATGIAF
jgi:hypothetical protein